MTKSLSVLFRGVALAALAAGSLSATATLLSYSANFDMSPAGITASASSLNGATTGFNSGPGNLSQVLNFNQFNASLGTLQSVWISSTSNIDAVTTVNVVLSNEDTGELPSLKVFSANGSLDGLITGPSGVYVDAFSASPSASCPALSLSPGCQSGPVPYTGAVGLFKEFLNADMQAFVGGGTFDLTASLASILALPPVADNTSITASLSDIKWVGQVTVTYNYLASTANPIPETLSLYLVMAGLAAMAWRRRQG